MRKVLSVLVLAIIGLACDSTSKEANPDALVGIVKVKGNPAKEISMTVFNSKGEVVTGGTTAADGSYIVPNPPKETLEFIFIAPGKGLIPDKYAKPKNGISVEYKGGKQTFDIDLK